MARGDHVMCLDNFFTGSKENIQHHIGKPNFEMIRHDVVEPIRLECDQVYHLACPASPPHYQYNPIKTIKTSTEGTLNMLGLAKRVRARVLLARTAAREPGPLRRLDARPVVLEGAIHAGPRRSSTATPRCTRSPRRTGGM